MARNRNRILVVDDEPKIVEVLRSYLEADSYEVHAAYNGKQALESFEKFYPALVVLDRMLPDLSGEDVCRAIRKKSAVPIIMLTAKSEEEDILQGLNMGADDYVTKPFSPRQLAARVAAVLRRTMDSLTPLAEYLSFHDGELTINSRTHEVKKKGTLLSLTPYEYRILTAMVRYPQKIFTREELITLVLGDDYAGYDRTIDSHIKNLRAKIEPDPKNPKYILTVYGTGYRFGGEQGGL